MDAEQLTKHLRISPMQMPLDDLHTRKHFTCILMASQGATCQILYSIDSFNRNTAKRVSRSLVYLDSFFSSYLFLLSFFAISANVTSLLIDVVRQPAVIKENLFYLLIFIIFYDSVEEAASINCFPFASHIGGIAFRVNREVFVLCIAKLHLSRFALHHRIMRLVI